MNFIDSVLLIRGMAGLYAIAALSGVLLYKHSRAANIIPNLLCIAASICGIAASASHIVSGSGRLAILDFQFPVPFISAKLDLDALSSFFILSLSVLALCVSIYSIGYVSHYCSKRNAGLFNFLYSLFILTMFLVFTAGNTVFFLIAWEAMSLVSYFLVVFDSDNKENQAAGTLYIVMTHVGTALLLLAFILIYSFTGSLDIFSIPGSMPGWARNVVFVSFLLGFGTKAGIIPLHIWLPYAHPAASSNVSSLMSGIMIKTAIYGLVRFILGYMGVQCLWWGAVILIVGAVSTILGVAYALMEHDIKRLLAYHSIENIGIILIGIGVSMIAFAQGNQVLCSLALIAALFHTFNHAVFKGGLFLGAGSIQYSTHVRDMEELGGLIKTMPYTAVFMLCFSLSICALVPFNGFVSEWLTYQSLFFSIGTGKTMLNIISVLSAAVLAMAGAMALACFVKMFGISFLGLPRSSHSKNAKESPWSMRIGMGILAAICLVLGLFPVQFIKLVDRAAASITGVSMIDRLQGKFMFIYYPIELSGNSIMPAAFLFILIALFLALAAIIRLMGGKPGIRRYGTWDCGFQSLTPRMQYSATGFSKPFRIVFKILYRPARELEVEEGVSPYFPNSLRYTVRNEKIFEKYIYLPLMNFFIRLSRKLKFSIQTGSIHMYLIYIFVAILALMLYNSLSF